MNNIDVLKLKKAENEMINEIQSVHKYPLQFTTENISIMTAVTAHTNILNKHHFETKELLKEVDYILGDDGYEPSSNIRTKLRGMIDKLYWEIN